MYVEVLCTYIADLFHDMGFDCVRRVTEARGDSYDSDSLKGINELVGCLVVCIPLYGMEVVIAI